MAISLLARYADFVRFLQPSNTEWWLGWIVGCGMIGSVLVRLAQGKRIDHVGPARMWIACGTIVTIALLLHLTLTTAQGPGIFLLRVVLYSSIAGMFGACTTFVSYRADEKRLAEIVGTLGTSGFVGMMFGPMIGDWIFSTKEVTIAQTQAMFIVAAGLTALATMFAFLATRGTGGPLGKHRRTLPVMWLLRRYFPGTIMLVGFMQGIILVIPQVFLAQYAHHLEIAMISGFFFVYAGTALTVRLLIRNFAKTHGIALMAVIGLTNAGLFCLLLIPVTEDWQLIPPAFFLGVAHAFLFPAHMAGGSASFPDRHRGVATSLMLMTMDLGVLVGGPLVGGMVYGSRQLGLPPYVTAFSLMAMLCLAVAFGYALTHQWRLPRPKRKTIPGPNWTPPAMATRTAHASGGSRGS